MRFGFSDEQAMTAEVVRKLLADTCRSADLRRLLATGAARDETRWAKILELGLAGMLVPEARGGLGLAPVDFVQIAAAAGRACLPEPLVDHAGVGLPLLAAFADDPRAARALERALAGAITVASGHPSNPLVEAADTAGALLLCRDGALHLVEPAAARLVHQPSVDPFRRLFTVAFAPSGDTLLAGPDAAAPALAAAAERGALFAAAQLLGLARRSVELAAAYARERRQFGKPIGSYQAVKHHLATVQVAIEFAEPVLHAAAGGFDPDDLHARARVSHAKLAATEAADLAARTAIQVHGAMGYSWEVDVHFFLKRMLALSHAWGGPAFHRGRVAERVFGAALGPDRTFARAGSDG